MAEFEELLDNEWRALLDSADDTVSASSTPLALPSSRRMPVSPIALFAQLEDVREEWLELRSAIRPDDARRYVNAAWTLRDLVAHVASWAQEFRREIETVLNGGSFDYAIPYALTVMGPNDFNQTQLEARASQSIDESFDELDRETSRLQTLLLEMSDQQLYTPATFPLAPSGDPAARWTGPSAAIIAGKCEHDRHHIAQLKKRLATWR